MKKRQTSWRIPFCLALVVVLAGCAKRHEEGMDVDSIQGRVDAIERNLHRMSEAIRRGQPDEAQRLYDQAREIVEEGKAELRAYPEFSELMEAMNRAPAELCLGFVNRAVVEFYAMVRKKDLDASKGKLTALNQENARCEPEIQPREDLSELKQNIASAPQALAELERVLEEERRVARMNKEIGGHAERLAAINKELADPDNQEKPGRLAEQILERTGKLQAELESSTEWTGRAEWEAFTKKTRQELATIENKRQLLLRQAKATDLVENILAPAARLAASGQGAKPFNEKEEALSRARDEYGRGEGELTALVKEDPRIAGYTRPWEGSQRSVAWLTTHCGQRAEEMKKLLRDLKKAEKAEKAAQAKKAAPHVRKPIKAPKKNPRPAAKAGTSR